MLPMVRPDDWHHHLRQGELLQGTVPAATCYGRCVVMPNLRDPVNTVNKAHAYKKEILQQLPPNKQGDRWIPLMTLFLCQKMTIKEIQLAKKNDIFGLKLYPHGVTTQSNAGPDCIKDLYPLFDTVRTSIGLGGDYVWV